MKNFKPAPPSGLPPHPAHRPGPRHVNTWRGFTVTIEAGTVERSVRVDPKDPSKGMRKVDVGAYLGVGVKDGRTILGKPCEGRGDALQSVYKAIDEALGEGVRRRAIKDANGHTVGTHLVRAHEAQRV